MNNIDWESLKKAVADNEEKEKENNTSVEYIIELNGEPVEVEIKKSNAPQNKYAMRKRLLAYYKYLMAMNYKTEEVKKLSISATEFLYSDFQHLYTSMKEDIKELDSCFSSGAYKATLILAGSVLEAFLLDWLSEIDGKNYFEEPYEINGKKCEFLSVYIDQIKEIERPDWMEPSEKDHFISKSRNSVH
ncbi:MAG: hypothetical protein IJ589_07345, partial [Lachnospiraceae bacterium]|nr:hypothetical protein [Lachnospiraceae bacterium]